MVGDHPELLRMLGLVIDVDVDDLAGLSQSTVLSATITVPALPADACRSPRVQVQAARDGALLTVPVSDQWQDGALALGGPSFTVLDLDADGTALKAERYLWSLPRLAKIEANGVSGLRGSSGTARLGIHGRPPAAARSTRSSGCRGRPRSARRSTSAPGWAASRRSSPRR